MKNNFLPSALKALALGVCVAAATAIPAEADANMSAEDISRLSAQHGARYVYSPGQDHYYMAIPAATSQATPDSPNEHKPNVGPTAGNREALAPNVTLVKSSMTRADMDDAERKLSEWYSRTSDSGNLSFMYDAMVDAIVIYPDQENSDAVQDQFGRDPRYRIAEPDPLELDDTRNQMGLPARGGGRLVGTNADTSGLVSNCSAGITARNANGTVGVFSAAHCFNLGERIRVGSGQDLGKVTHSYTTHRLDAQFISGGSNYSPRVFTGSLSSQTTKPVKLWYFPPAGQGNRLCFSGITSGENCSNTIIDYNGTTCWTLRGVKSCSNHMIVLAGGSSSQSGDSGGTAYANFGDTVRVSGIVHGHKIFTLHGPMTFITDWRQIEKDYDAQLVFG